MPFRKVEALVNDGETVDEAFNSHILDHERCLEAHKKFTKLLQAEENIKDIKDTRAANREEENKIMEDDDPQLLGQINDAMKDVKEMDTGSTLTLQESRCIVDNIKAHLLKQIEYEQKTKKRKNSLKVLIHCTCSSVVSVGLVNFF